MKPTPTRQAEIVLAFAKSNADGERIRMREQIARLRGLISGFEVALGSNTPLLESAQAVADTADRLASTAARFDAYLRVATVATER